MQIGTNVTIFSQGILIIFFIAAVSRHTEIIGCIIIKTHQQKSYCDGKIDWIFFLKKELFKSPWHMYYFLCITKKRGGLTLVNITLCALSSQRCVFVTMLAYMISTKSKCNNKMPSSPPPSF